MAYGNRLVTVAGGNLFRLAVEYYGNALLWTRIAAANGMDDPFFSDTRTLVIPPPDPSVRSDGILYPP